jgi:CBS domain-containing protein
MKIRQAMTPDVHMVSPQLSICQAAQLMANEDIGALPVGEGDRLVGMITDRDIAVRAVAQGLGPDTPIQQVMSPEVKYCFDDEDLDSAARNMAGIKVRRLPVLNRDKRLVGILSLSDLSHHAETGQLGIAVSGVSVPGGAHSQAPH